MKKMIKNTLFGVAMVGTILAGTNSVSAATSFNHDVKSGTPHTSLKDSNGNPLIDDKKYYIQPYDNPEGKLDISIKRQDDASLWVTTTGHKMTVQILSNERISLESSSVSYNKGEHEGYDDKGPLWGRLTAYPYSSLVDLNNPYTTFKWRDPHSIEWRILDRTEGNYYRINSPMNFKDLQYTGMNNSIRAEYTSKSTSLLWRFVPAE